jgi:hypothetical protein
MNGHCQHDTAAGLPLSIMPSRPDVVIFPTFCRCVRGTVWKTLPNQWLGSKIARELSRFSTGTLHQTQHSRTAVRPP